MEISRRTGSFSNRQQWRPETARWLANEAVPIISSPRLCTARAGLNSRLGAKMARPIHENGLFRQMGHGK